MALISDAEGLALLSKEYGIPVVDLTEQEIDANAIALVSRDIAEGDSLIPVGLIGIHTIVIAMSDPSNIFAIHRVRKASGRDVEVLIAGRAAVEQAIAVWYAGQKST